MLLSCIYEHHKPITMTTTMATTKNTQNEVAWAKSTREFNPTMLGDVEAGRIKWYPALIEYLDRVLYA